MLTYARLTVLAFLYIPLSCVCSAFGMNIREMNPYPSIWVFAAVAVCVTAITVTIASYQLLQNLLQEIISWLCRLPYHLYWARLYVWLFLKDLISNRKKRSAAMEP